MIPTLFPFLASIQTPTSDLDWMPWMLGIFGTIPRATTFDNTAKLKIGGWQGGRAFNAGDSMEHGIVGRAISDAEALQLCSYLAAKYAL